MQKGKIIAVCDRCGFSEASDCSDEHGIPCPPASWLTFEQGGAGRELSSYSPSKIHLCPTCVLKFARWMSEAAEGVTADQLAHQVSVPRSKTEDASEWLHEQLSDGPMDSRAIKTAAEARGFTPKVLRNAREQLGVIDERKGKAGVEHRSVWRLPDLEPGTPRVNFKGVRRTRGGSSGAYLTVDEAAALLRIGRNQLYNAIGRGDVPHRRIGKSIRLSRAALVRWLEGEGRRST